MFNFFKKSRTKDSAPQVKYKKKPRPIKDALLYIFATTTACNILFGYAVYTGRIIVPLQKQDLEVYDSGIGKQQPQPVANNESPDMVDQLAAAELANKSVELSR